MSDLQPSDLDIDRAPVAPAGSLGGIPIIDLRSSAPQLVEQIGRACREWGFFQVVNHGIDQCLIENLRSATKGFFSQPREAKRALLRSRDNPWGYYDRELTKEQRDKKEVFDLGPDLAGFAGDGGPFSGRTPLPVMPSNFGEVMRSYFCAVAALSKVLVEYIGESLGDTISLSSAYAPEHTSFLRLNYYPVKDPLSGETEELARLGIHHHTDAGALTVLLQDEVPGLQVLRDRHWHEVPPIDGAFTINIGDMIQVWSNDLYRAALHRVRAMEDVDRYSVPFFYNPGYDTSIAPVATDEPHYSPIHWGDYRRRRADGDFASYGTEVQISDYRIEPAQ